MEMPARITLRMTKGQLSGQQFVFAERTCCIIGRDEECWPRLPHDDEHLAVSRHHCLLDINPPDIRIRDFGSLNGTWVNGRKIGQREEHMSPEDGARMPFAEHDLKDGDEITLGKTVFRVAVHVPAYCAECAAELAEEQREPDVYRCATCRQKVAAAKQPAPPPLPQPPRCAKCGRDVVAEAGRDRPGVFICAACREDPFKLLQQLLEAAKSGDKDLVAIQGYTVERELGRGGMGAVYLARRERSGEQVALKVMLPRVAAHPRATEMFLREIENTKALKHRHVVELRDVGCSRGTFFFTCEFCDGGSVDKLLQRRGGRLTIQEAAPIILETLEGLHYAHHAPLPQIKLQDGGYGHGRGLVHRDLSPHNIFLAGTNGSRVAKVGDYGLAKAFDTAGLSGQTRTGAIAGKPWFMPRQQVRNYKYTQPEVDVWAAAACLYFMVAGCFPRDFSRGQDVWKTVLSTDPIPIRRRETSIPKRLADVIDTALTDRPRIIFTSAAEFKRHLENAL